MENLIGKQVVKVVDSAAKASIGYVLKEDETHVFVQWTHNRKGEKVEARYIRKSWIDKTKVVLNTAIPTQK